MNSGEHCRWGPGGFSLGFFARFRTTVLMFKRALVSARPVSKKVPAHPGSKIFSRFSLFFVFSLSFFSSDFFDLQRREGEGDPGGLRTDPFRPQLTCIRTPGPTCDTGHQGTLPWVFLPT